LGVRVGEGEGEDGVPRLGYLQDWNSSAASCSKRGEM